MKTKNNKGKIKYQCPCSNNYIYISPEVFLSKYDSQFLDVLIANECEKIDHSYNHNNKNNEYDNYNPNNNIPDIFY